MLNLVKVTVLLFCFAFPVFSFGQALTGIGTKTPSNTLHVKSTSDPLRLEGLQKGVMSDVVLVADANGVVKAVKSVAPKYFYAPAIYIPTHSINSSGQAVLLTTAQTINIYQDYYKGRYDWADASKTNKVRSPAANAASSILPIYAANELHYFITWYDDKVFENVSISDAGILQYSVKPGAIVTSNSFMNIVFKVID